MKPVTADFAAEETRAPLGYRAPEDLNPALGILISVALGIGFWLLLWRLTDLMFRLL